MSDMPISLVFDEPPLEVLLWFLYDAGFALRVDPSRALFSWESDEEADAHDWKSLPPRDELREAFMNHGPVTMSVGLEFVTEGRTVKGSALAACWSAGEYYLAITPHEGAMLWHDALAPVFARLAQHGAGLDCLIAEGVRVRIGADVSLPGEPYACLDSAICRTAMDIERLINGWRARLPARPQGDR